MSEIDFIVISQSEVVNYEEFSKLPKERVELYKELIFPRMVYFKNGFRSHLDIINYLRDGIFYADAEYPVRRKLLNIWNLLGVNGVYLANYLSQYNIKTKIINNFDSDWDLLCSAYKACKKPPLVGISTTFYMSYREVRRIIKKIRNIFPGVNIAIGGAFTNEQFISKNIQSFEKPMRKYGVDYVFHAFNSEPDLKDLILKRKNNLNINEFYNTVYIEDGKYKTTPVRFNSPVLDEAPVLWEQIDIPLNGHTVQMRTSSGCPFACTFCSYPKTAKTFKVMPCAVVEKHINALLNIPGIDKIIFIDDTFNAVKSRFKDMCHMFSKSDFEWFSFLRVQFVDEETVRLMKESGCKAVYLGIESANEVVLKNMNKKATPDQFMRGIKLLKKYDIASVAAFIIGFPGETEKSIDNNIEFIETSGIDFYTLKEFYYMRHTSVYERRNEFGLSGIGNKWEHSTMDYMTAYNMKIKMFQLIKNSVFIDADTSLWYIAYLFDQGYSIDNISRIQKEINSIILSQYEGIYDHHPSIENLKHLVSI